MDLTTLKLAIGKKASYSTVIHELIIVYGRRGTNSRMLSNEIQNQLIYRQILEFVNKMLDHDYLASDMNIMDIKNIISCAVHNDMDGLGLILEGINERKMLALKEGVRIMKAVTKKKSKKKVE